mmetsp:Transcript_53388/g.135479  ORF Transcript_53388/g.135479 Transcript_53388/m.135479 type:complete len:116 (-) Transcript_53388:117-464(-)
MATLYLEPVDKPWMVHFFKGAGIGFTTIAPWRGWSLPASLSHNLLVGTRASTTQTWHDDGGKPSVGTDHVTTSSFAPLHSTDGARTDRFLVNDTEFDDGDSSPYPTEFAKTTEAW